MSFWCLARLSSSSAFRDVGIAAATKSLSLLASRPIKIMLAVQTAGMPPLSPSQSSGVLFDMSEV